MPEVRGLHKVYGSHGRRVYQGINPSAGGDYIALPWRLGLLTQTNSPC